MKTYTKKYILNGLDCANCAEKIRAGVENSEGVINAEMNFMVKELKIKANHEDEEKLLKNVTKIVKKLEPEVTVSEKAIEQKNHKGEIIRIAIAAVLFVFGLVSHLAFADVSWLTIPSITALIIAYILTGVEVAVLAVKNIIKGNFFDENFLMFVATIGAVAIGEIPEAVAIMVFYRVGELFQKIAVSNSRKSITGLMDIRPDYANIMVNSEIVRVNPSEIKIGDTVIVKPGEKIPLDGIIKSGDSYINNSALTGESVPVNVSEGSEVLSGAVNQNGMIEITVTKTFENSTASKILELVQNAGSKKSKTENFITKFAKIYTPVVVILAVAVSGILMLSGGDTFESIKTGLIFLVVSCPCALVISIPLSYFAAIGGASKKGVLVKGGNYFEALGTAKTVVFDKTGTLTKGVFKVNEIYSENFSKEELLEIAAYGESNSSHPIAVSILNAYGKKVNVDLIKNYAEIAGQGISAEIMGKNVLVGNSRLMKENNISYKNTAVTNVQVAVDGVYAGYITLSDEIKPESKEAVNALKNIGVRKIVMLTGDKEEKADETAKELGITEVYAELLPGDKIEMVERLQSELSKNEKLIFVGDGINDAPVLARADVGVSMGVLGSDSAIEAADVVLMNDNPMQISDAIKIARKTKSVVMQNIVFALAVKFVIQVLSIIGAVSIWGAVFADVGVSVIAILNALRLIYKTKK